jgi:hypothetical protein
MGFVSVLVNAGPKCYRQNNIACLFASNLYGIWHMKRLQLLILFQLVFFGEFFTQAPADILGSWTMFFNQVRISEKWSVHTEAQFRSYELIPRTEQILLRAGINYHFNNSCFVTGGIAYVTTDDFDKNIPGVLTTENRVWQQVFIRHNIGRCFLEHRYRLEQRWIVSKNDSRYIDRLRYMIRVSAPLNKDKMEKNTFFVSLYNELFMHLAPIPFDRNRLYGAVGYQFSPLSNIQLGYLAQTVNVLTKHYLQIAVFYNVDLRKKNS